MDIQYYRNLKVQTNNYLEIFGPEVKCSLNLFLVLKLHPNLKKMLLLMMYKVLNMLKSDSYFLKIFAWLNNYQKIK